MQFSKILIATAALAMAVVAAPIAGEDHDGEHTEIHDSGNVENKCSNQASHISQVCCNDSSKPGTAGLVSAVVDVLSIKDILNDTCFGKSNCDAGQRAVCCQQDNNGFAIIDARSCIAA